MHMRVRKFDNNHYGKEQINSADYKNGFSDNRRLGEIVMQLAKIHIMIKEHIIVASAECFSI